MEPTCKHCGSPMQWEDCWNGCDEGYFDASDEDPINFSEGEEFEVCNVCNGREGWWWCANQKCPSKNEAA